MCMCTRLRARARVSYARVRTHTRPCACVDTPLDCCSSDVIGYHELSVVCFLLEKADKASFGIEVV